MLDKTISQYALELIKKYAEDGSLKLIWTDKTAQIAKVCYDNIIWRDELIKILGHPFVLQLDHVATETLEDGSYTEASE